MGYGSIQSITARPLRSIIVRHMDGDVVHIETNMVRLTTSVYPPYYLNPWALVLSLLTSGELL